jgi:hypothetical protein
LTIDKDDDDDSLTTVIVPYERGVILDQFVAVDKEQAVTETRIEVFLTLKVKEKNKTIVFIICHKNK